MQPFYIRWHAVSDASLASVIDTGEEIVLLTGIAVPEAYRGAGFGRELMREICEDADKEEKILILSVDPGSNPTGLNYDSLAAWYGRNGFEMLEDQRTMRRFPNGQNGSEPQRP